MGSSPYFYFVPFDSDYNAALAKLRNSEFEAGRYNPVVMFPEFPISKDTESPGKQHSSIEEAMEEAEEDGTRSILDINTVSEKDDYCNARILKNEELISIFGTDKPTHEMLETNYDYFESIERGKAYCITVFKEDKPSEIYFVGYSFD